MAIKYLDAKRLQGTNAERLAMTSSANVPASLCYNMTLDTTNEILGSGCWSFDGSSSYVDLTLAFFRNGVWASGGSAFTVAYWFRASSGEYFTNSTQCMTSSESEIGFLYSYPGYAVTLGASQSPTTYHDDNWHHVTIRWDNSDIICNIDSNFSTSSPTATGGATVSPPTWNTTTSAISLGGKFDSPNCTTGVVGGIRSAYVLDGEMDDYGIWNRTLTDGELEDLWNSGSGAKVDSISTTDLLVYYNFEQAVADGLTNQAGTNVIPNLPNGTIFNVTDTYKYFMVDGTDTWNQMVSS